MEQTKTDPGRKKKKPLRRCGIFFACLLFLFLCSFVYISKNPRARMLLSVIYFMQNTLKDPAYIAYHIDIMELCQDYFNGDISFEGKAYLNDIKNFKFSSSMDISGERSFAQKKLSIISDMDVLTLNVGEMDFYMNPNTVYFMVPMLDNLSYAMTTSNTYFKKAPELTHDIDQEWFHDNFSNIIELTRQIQIEETGKTRTDSDDVKSHEYLVTIPEGSGGFIWELLGMDTPDYDIRVSLYLTDLCRMSRMEVDLSDITEGASMIIDGTDVTKLSEYKRAAYLGRVFQDPMTGTAATMGIEENLALAKRRGKTRFLRSGITKAEREEYKELLKILNLGLEDRLTSKVGLLSGGQRQALTLLMATLQKPKLLLLDEHTAALDPKTAAKVLDITDRIVNRDHLTTLMITHNMKDAIAHGNRLIMMMNGKIILDIQGEEKKKLTVKQLLDKFEEASGEEFSNDSAILG